MKKIWNSLRYGDATTRKCIGSVILFSVLGIVLIIVAGLTGHFNLFMIGMIAGVVAIIISQTFTLVDDDYVAEVDQKGKKDTVRAMSAQRSSNEKKEHKQSESVPQEERQESAAAQEEQLKDESRDEKRFAYYNEQVMKKIKRKYRLKKDHRPIIIDSSASYRIRECPAFIWRAHDRVYILLLEKEPRKISISREMIRHMDYVPNVPGDRTQEYIAFRKESMITRVFEEYLPDYVLSKERNSNTRHKNLYMIYPDIRISNRSASQVLDLLCLNFMPQDKITKSDKINGFFKRIYAGQILYRDHVYSITEYKQMVEKVLTEMCYADMPEREFVITLENLVRGQLISQEYADYYSRQREKAVSESRNYSRERN
ncbi:MAG: hypothetical protein IJ801_05900 [Lachnospiraceae bacterium]|nr:hypothetical protein [Lachnospiraceae bacterium]